MAKKDQKLDFMSVAMAVGVGLTTQPLIDKLQETKTFKEKPEMVPLVMFGAGAVASYFAPEKYKIIGYSLMTLTAGDLASGLFKKEDEGSKMIGDAFILGGMDGFSRVNVMGDLPEFDLSGTGRLEELDEIMQEESDGMSDEY